MKITKLPPDFVGKVKYRKPEDVPWESIPSSEWYFDTDNSVRKLSNREEEDMIVDTDGRLVDGDGDLLSGQE